MTDTPRGWGKLLFGIYQAADWIVDHTHEVILILEPDNGRIIHRVDGELGSKEVHLQSELTKGRIVIHNHPDEFTFSGEDVAASAEQDVWLAVVVTHHDLYFLECPEDGWPSPQGIWFDGIMAGVTYGDALNTDNAVREEAIREIVASAGGFYWRQCAWRDNMKLLQD